MESEYSGNDTVHKQWITMAPITLLGNPMGATLTDYRGHRWVDGSKTEFIIELTITTDGMFENRAENDKLTLELTAGLAINNPVTIYTLASATQAGTVNYSPILVEMGSELIRLRAFPFQKSTVYSVKFQGHYRTLET